MTGLSELLGLAMAHVCQVWDPRKATGGEKKKTPPSPGPTHQDCHHDADVLGVLPEHVVQGDFGKVCQPAEEHQKAQHLQH